MNRWSIIITQSNKWILYALESYVLFIVGTIFFHIFFLANFTMSPFEIWLAFIVLSSFYLISKKKYITYSVILLLLLLGVLYYNFSIVSWIIFLMLFIWRFSLIEEDNQLEHDAFYSRVVVYIVLSFVLFVLHSFFEVPMDIHHVLISYLVVFGLYLAGGITNQLKLTKYSKRLLHSLLLQLTAILTAFGIIGVSIYFLIEPLSKAISFVKNTIYHSLLYLVNIVFVTISKLMVNMSEEQKEKLENLGRNIKDGNREVLTIKDSDGNFPYLDIIVSVVFVMVLIIIIFLLVKRITPKRTTALQSMEKLENDISFQSKEKVKNKRYSSNNVYRKLYQQLMIWLIRKKKLSLETKVLTSKEITEQIKIKHPDLAEQMEALTENYRRVRYGNLSPSIAEKDFKEMVKQLKTAIKADK